MQWRIEVGEPSAPVRQKYRLEEEGRISGSFREIRIIHPKFALKCHFQAELTMDGSVYRGSQPSLVFANELSATSSGGSPSRRGPYSTGRRFLETSSIASTISLTLVPCPVPKLSARLSPPPIRYSIPRLWASARSETWTKSRMQLPSRVG